MKDLDDVLREIKSAVTAGQLIILVGEMSVHYEGRSVSWLGRGERILIIKQDRSVLVHRPRGYEAINWQPPGSHIETWTENDSLIIASSRTSPPEKLKISISKILQLYCLKLKDDATFQIHAREEDMKLAIMEEPSIIEDGFAVIESERRVRDGFIDILGLDRSGRLVVVEIKREKADTTDIDQLLRYSSQIEEEFGSKPRQIIVAPLMTTKATRKARMLGVEFRRLSPRTAQTILKKRKGLDRFLSDKS